MVPVVRGDKQVGRCLGTCFPETSKGSKAQGAWAQRAQNRGIAGIQQTQHLLNVAVGKMPWERGGVAPGTRLPEPGAGG